MRVLELRNPKPIDAFVLAEGDWTFTAASCSFPHPVMGEVR
jgi:hypothetical protein